MDPTKYDDDVERLNENKGAWANLDVDTKISLLADVRQRFADVAERQVEEALKNKGILASSPVAGEEWFGGPVITIRNLRLLERTLRSISETGKPPLDEVSVSTNNFDRVVADVLPVDKWDEVMYKDFSAEVWMKPEVDRDEIFNNMASFYDKDEPYGGVSLVLGAGNVASIAPLDVVYKLFAEGHVCLLKMNPINDYLGAYIEEAFEGLIERGFVRLAYGGAKVGSYLCEHDGIDDIHITGSDKTHDKIVFGTGQEGKKRKEENRPKLDKPITSELGNVSPVIVVPGDWSQAELEFQAENIATQLANNAGFNCNAARVIITPKNWAHRDRLIEEVADVLSDIEQREAYYPGAEERFEEFLDSHDDVIRIGSRTEKKLPWSILKGVDPNDENHICFREEAFCGVMCETGLDVEPDSPGEFLSEAVDFCNETLWGTLNACVIVDPKTEKQIQGQLEEALNDLEYGSIVLNHWPAISYGMGVTTWGAYPGHTLQDIQSGIGVVHNTLLFDKPEKSIVRGPFKIWPKPPWFVTNQRGHEIGPRLVEFESDRNVWNFAKVFWQAIRG